MAIKTLRWWELGIISGLRSTTGQCLPLPPPTVIFLICHSGFSSHSREVTRDRVGIVHLNSIISNRDQCWRQICSSSHSRILKWKATGWVPHLNRLRLDMTTTSKCIKGREDSNSSILACHLVDLCSKSRITTEVEVCHHHTLFRHRLQISTLAVQWLQETRIHWQISLVQIGQPWTPLVTQCRGLTWTSLLWIQQDCIRSVPIRILIKRTIHHFRATPHQALIDKFHPASCNGPLLRQTHFFPSLITLSKESTWWPDGRKADLE